MTQDSSPAFLSRTFGASMLLTSSSARPSASGDVASMSLAEKVKTTAAAGVARAAKDAGGALGTFLKDPKNDALLIGGTAVVAGAQVVPGVNVAVDATLGVVGAAMYLSAGPEHLENVTKALGKLKEYVSDVGGAKSPADLDKASNAFAAFLEIGGKEAADALGVAAGALSAPTKFFGLAEKAKALGGIDGVIAAGSKGAHAVGNTLNAAATEVRHGFDAIGGWLESAGRNAGLSGEPAFALPGGRSLPSSHIDRAFLESRRHDASEATRRNVHDHEVSGGHTIARHDKNIHQLTNRLAAEPKRDAASGFTSASAANRAQGAFVKSHRAEINRWLADPKRSSIMTATYDTGKPVGMVLERGKSAPSETTKAFFLLVRDDSPQGWHFKTSYPVK